MTPIVELLACGLAALAGFGIGLWAARRRADGRAAPLSFYPHSRTGAELRRRLFGP